MIETSEAFRKIKDILDTSGAWYELVEHEPVYTSAQAAAVRGFDLRGGAKALVFNADQKPILIVVRGDQKVDSRAFKKASEIRDLQLLPPNEVLRITGLEVGCIPPFGNILELPTYVDQGVLDNEVIAFNPGSHTKSVKMRSADYRKLCDPIIGSFAA